MPKGFLNHRKVGLKMIKNNIKWETWPQIGHGKKEKKHEFKWF
jgi:hypothetical protein